MKAILARTIAGIFAAGLMASAANAALVISYRATSNVVCTSGVCTAVAANAVLNAGALQVMLERSDVTVTAGTAATSIVIAAPMSWPGRRALTLDASRLIRINAEVALSGRGAVTLFAGDGSAPSFGSGGRLTFSALQSGLTINGRAYKLVNSIRTLAAAVAADSSAAIALAKDYDAGPDGVYPDSPVPLSFGGSFNGLGHTIGNFSLNFRREITDPPGVHGLFAELAASGTIENLALTNADVSSDDFGNIGLLMGQNRGAIARVAVSGRAIGTRGANVVGGLVGFNVSSGRITNSLAAAQVLDGFFTGGLVGFNQGFIARSSASGSVISHEDLGVVGGLVGQSDRSSTDREVTPTITQSLASSVVIGHGREAFIGGSVGWSVLSTVVNCFATGPVSGAAANGKRFVGGLIGVTNQTLLGSNYAIGAVTGVAGDRIGGLVGDYTLPIRRLEATNYWDSTTTNVTRGTGLGVSSFGRRTSAQLRAGLPAGFNPDIWGLSSSRNSGYPFLKTLVASALTLPLQAEERVPASPAATQGEPRRLTIALQPPPRVRHLASQ